MFKSDHERRDIALFLLEQFKDYFFTTGAPFNENTLAQTFKNVFLATDVFLHVGSLKGDELMQYLRPPQVMPRPNGAPKLAEVPVVETPKAS
jgi:hypothetical protein